MPAPQTLFFALLGGLLPALLWLWFWLREDKLHPEPRQYLFLSFLLGMIAVFVALPLERYSQKIVLDGTLVLVAWAAIEESVKLAAAYFAGLDRKVCDEPLDPMVYLITSALGFAAMENTLFLISSIQDSAFSGLI